MLIALTGGTGFLGRHVIQAFHSRGFSVRAWYRGDHRPTIAGVDWVPGELGDPDAAERLVDGCDGVVHTALSRGGGSFMAEPVDPVSYFETNVVGTLRLIEAARFADVNRFVFVSSGTVHEKVADDLPLDERHPLWPASTYGASKASVETLVHAYGLSGKLNITSVRPVSIVGIDDPIEKSSWFDLVRSVADGKSTKVSGGGKIVYVRDVAAAITLLSTTDRPIAGQTYNACSGFVSHHRVATITKELSGSHAELIGEAKSVGHQMKTDKLQELGMEFCGEESLREIIRDLLPPAESGIDHR